MTQADGPTLTVGLLLLALASCGVLTGCSTTRTNTSFAENPTLWCIGIGMQLFISILCLINCSFIARPLALEWLPQAISSYSATNTVGLIVIFMIGSSICAALCLGARKLILLLRTDRELATVNDEIETVLPQQNNSHSIVGSANFSTILKTSSKLEEISYSRKDRIFYGVLTVFISGLFALMSYATVYSFPWQWHWSSTTGVITAVRQSAKTQNVEYSYTADNRHFVANQRFHLHGMLVHKGDSVVVRYDPALVARCAIQTGPTIATGLWIICSIFSLMAAIDQFKAPAGPGYWYNAQT